MLNSSYHHPNGVTVGLFHPSDYTIKNKKLQTSSPPSEKNTELNRVVVVLVLIR